MEKNIEDYLDYAQKGLSNLAEKHNGNIPTKEVVFHSWDLILRGMPYVRVEEMTEYVIQGVKSIKDFIESKNRPREQVGLKYLLRLMEMGTSMKDQSLQSRECGVTLHCQNVGKYLVAVSKAMGLSSAEIYNFFVAASVHDVGKNGIPDSILMKPGKLTDSEYSLMKKHPEIGRHVIDTIDFVFQVPSIDIIRDGVEYHHERFFGGGYPHNLQGDNIPLCPRIVAICDAFDAMTNVRTYCKPRTPFEAVAEILHNDRGQFDPELAQVAAEPLVKSFSSGHK